MLKSASNARNIFIDPKCRELLKDLRQVKWRRDSSGNLQATSTSQISNGPTSAMRFLTL
jgi:hypothetical protein